MKIALLCSTAVITMALNASGVASLSIPDFSASKDNELSSRQLVDQNLDTEYARMELIAQKAKEREDYLNNMPITDVCGFHAQKKEQEYNIPFGYLHAITFRETGKTLRGGKKFYPHPWTISLNLPNGNKSFYFDTRQEAERKFKSLLAQGYENMDVGCGQLNYFWHIKGKMPINKVFSPEYNLSYAANYLVTLHNQNKSWKEAIGKYHSSTPEKKKSYLAGVMTMWKTHVSRIGKMKHLDKGEHTYVASN